VVVTSALDPCLVAYAPAEWAAFEEKLARLPQFDRAVQKLRRIYVSGAVECEFDDVGRILVPPTLREHASLKKDVLWAGAGRYAELWDKDAWQRHFDTTDDEKRDIASRLAELGL
jgi:MraZ protein